MAGAEITLIVPVVVYSREFSVVSITIVCSLFPLVALSRCTCTEQGKQAIKILWPDSDGTTPHWPTLALKGTG